MILAGEFSHKFQDYGVYRARAIPKLNAVVRDKLGRPIGRVIDVIGPLKSPFILVRAREFPEKIFIRRSEIWKPQR